VLANTRKQPDRRHIGDDGKVALKLGKVGKIWSGRKVWRVRGENGKVERNTTIRLASKRENI
jgi:hypothetical protein